MTELQFKYIINEEDAIYPIGFLMDNNFIKKINKTKIEKFELHLCKMFYSIEVKKDFDKNNFLVRINKIRN